MKTLSLIIVTFLLTLNPKSDGVFVSSQLDENIQSTVSNCALSGKEIGSIGATHNNSLTDVRNSLTGNNLNELYTSYTNYLKASGKDAPEYSVLNVKTTEEFFTFNVSNFSILSSSSSRLKTSTQQAIDAVINSTSESDLNTDLNTLLASKSWALLDNCEYMALEVFCQVAKSSGTYWKQNNPKPASGKWSFGKFIASDALGAYGGFLRSAVLAPVPGANSVIAVSAAWGAVWSSASYSLLNAGG